MIRNSINGGSSHVWRIYSMPSRVQPFTCSIPMTPTCTLRGIIVPISQVIRLKPREVKSLVQTQAVLVLEFTLTSACLIQGAYWTAEPGWEPWSPKSPCNALFWIPFLSQLDYLREPLSYFLNWCCFREEKDFIHVVYLSCCILKSRSVCRESNLITQKGICFI